ncbi:2-dehydropantoate 2-reductase [Cladophialophora yegresii CBS 114405]|uniref:2-dehydropantoate 2-reductase n=1 Tax=Cladophialophora yegresii CBS 114405 TaxID=1182544 RepID=W9VLY2_9EURO|nr:2-dehydropantoate 2-reductase [Cladophialophora yegresii CBS 114405]EXJ54000.1 2-dehydropantoate 2-reductase [Cladophialophora yegresii CBS 114405]
MAQKARVLLVGAGGIGTMTALNLERGGLAEVTAVLRSNYAVVRDKGFTIDSCDHGKFEGWRPTKVLNSIPDLSGSTSPEDSFDYIICTTKNIPDVPPTLVDLIKPAVTPGHSVIVLIQNGLNIEKPLLTAFPGNICLSGVSLMGADELSPGHILENDVDRLYIGPFLSETMDKQRQIDAAEEFVRIYSASGKVQCSYQPDVLFVRWRKLMYNAVWNPICALTDLDTTRFRLASEDQDPASPLNLLVRPAMNEIRAAAKAAANVELPESLVEDMVECDPIEIFCAPSMQQDRRKKRYMEFENILGEALGEGEKAGVAMPTVKCLYGLCKAIQWRTKEQNGLVDARKLMEERKARTGS